jgi:glycosyltransferase involved in cell wall biosynthesis
MKSPLLSICIATYNRADFIGETLESIINQLSDEVEIVVVDGASTDNTQTVMERYVANCPSLRYIRLPQKGGVDQDFCKAVEHANGEYCWLFSDDDLYKPGALQRVIQELRNNHSLVIVNADVMNRDFSILFQPSMLENTEDEIYKPDHLDALFRRIVPTISFIGCVVIKRDIWLQREHDRYFGTEFIHVGVIFQELLPGTAYLIAQPCISIRYGNAQWTSRSFEIWMQKWPCLIWSFPLISDETKRKRVKPEPWRRLKTLRLYRALGSYSEEMYEKIIVPSSASALWKLAALAIARIPQPPWNAYMLWYLKTFRNKKSKQMTIYDLSLSSQNNAIK